MERPTSKRHALELSVKHWRKNYTAAKNRRSILTSAHNCACCYYARNKFGTIECLENCLVAEYTGHSSCFYTPYYRAVELGIDYRECDKRIAGVKEMYEWLKDLKNGKKPPLFPYERTESW